MIQTPINETLPAAGAGSAQITLGSAQDCADFIIQARGAVDMKISDTEALTKYWTVKSGTAMSINKSLGQGAAFFWAESGAGADVVEVLPLDRHRNQ